MQTINLYEAKNSFSKLVDAAQEGEVIIIARNGKPTAKLVALDYGERSSWSESIRAFMQEDQDQYEEQAFEVDRSDVLPMPEHDLF